ncbi:MULTISPECIES: TIGR03915 family putative DNA repair protein [unclassified Acidovorax]|uniref:TIGR03915 family putative DNA repair protein n=1 Tax=unclassified Acidovorax TaxID=2684926 RepID=UPI0028830467|nr:MULTISPECIES: TIGR03915 family putative DNA repair protein [unclassified Acidovorax]
MPHSVTLRHAADWAGFRDAARTCLQAGLEPMQVHWQVAGAAETDLFGGDSHEEGEPAHAFATAADTTSAARVPRAFITLGGHVALHSDPDRYALLYRALWRLAHDPALRHDTLDADLSRMQRMAAAVRRDMHKMRAFVRFRAVDDGEEQPLHVAWFEPDHHIAEANAAFFVQRFTQMRWAILTPECSLRWDGDALQIGPGATRADAPPPDAGEALWLTYYQHTFNPARLKLAMMRREMPTRYWKNLPEAALIDSLARGAYERSARMVHAGGTEPHRRIPKVG